MSKFLTMRWPEGLVAAVDSQRGLQARSAWIREAVEERLPDHVIAAYEDVPVEKKAAPVIPDVKPASEVFYRCSVQGCAFKARSSFAKCPRHPGKLVAA